MVLNEQRTSARKVLKVKAKLMLDGAGPMAARTQDISSAGMSITVAEPCRSGASGLVSFDLFYDGKTTAIHARAKVSYCILSGNEFKIGLQFLNLDLSAMALLAKFMR